MAWDFYIHGQGRCVGAVSSATLRPEDLVPAFLSELETVRTVSTDLMHDARAWIAGRKEWQEYYDDGEPDTYDAWGHTLVMELMTELDHLAPEGFYFGATEGDGSCFGWWRVEDDVDLWEEIM